MPRVRKDRRRRRGDNGTTIFQRLRNGAVGGIDADDPPRVALEDGCARGGSGSCEGLDADYGDIGSRLKDVEAQIIRRLEAEPLTPSSTDGMRMAC